MGDSGPVMSGPLRGMATPRGWAISVPLPPLAVWLPSLLVGLAMLLPLAYLVLRGVGASEQAWGLLLRPRTAYILGRSVLLMVIVTAASVLLAVPLAWLTLRTDLPLRRVWSVLTALPLVVPSYVGAFLMVSALGPRGLVQQVFGAPLGIERLPDIYGLPGAAITLTLLCYPYVLLTVRGAMSNLSPALDEAARGLGYGQWATLFHVTLPQLRPAMAAGGLLVALYVLSDFGAVSLMRYETFTWAIYLQYQSAFDRSIAAVLSLVLVALAAAVLLMEGYSRGRLRYYQSGRGVSRAQPVVRLGRWRWPALALCAAVVLAALVMPMAVLGYWLVRGLASGEPLLLLWYALRNSVYVSGLAALAAAACSVPVAVLVVRYPGLFSRAIEGASFVGYALPGIVVALALVFFGANYATPAYQTVWLLVFAYLVLFFPVALGAVRATLVQVSPRLEDAARSLGRTPLETLLTITLPLVRPGILAGAALVFLVTMKELPATLVLGPLGFKTLATSIWSASSEAFFAQAAAPALMLILMSSVPMAFLYMREARPGLARREV